MVATHSPVVVARDPKRGVVLLGALGSLGIGQMWVEEEPRHESYPGYAEAEIVDTGDQPLFGITLPWEL